MIRREFHFVTKCEDYDDGANYDSKEDKHERITPVAEGDANLISSRIAGQGHDSDEMALHAPVLDIDFPAALIPSSTPGHFHLYLEKPIPWPAYENLLNALADANIIERGFANASISRHRTFVRKFDVPKPVKPEKRTLAEKPFDRMPF